MEHKRADARSASCHTVWCSTCMVTQSANSRSAQFYGSDPEALKKLADHWWWKHTGVKKAPGRLSRAQLEADTQSLRRECDRIERERDEACAAQEESLRRIAALEKELRLETRLGDVLQDGVIEIGDVLQDGVIENSDRIVELENELRLARSAEAMWKKSSDGWGQECSDLKAKMKALKAERDTWKIRGNKWSDQYVKQSNELRAAQEALRHWWGQAGVRWICACGASSAGHDHTPDCATAKALEATRD